MSNYHPHSGYKDNELDAYLQDITDFIDVIPKNNTIIIGANLNALIGTRKITTTNDPIKDNDTINNIIRPHSNPHRNHRGRSTLKMLRQLNFQAASTFFDNNNKHDTWINPNTKTPFQLDHILILKNQLLHTQNVKQRFNRTTSNHAALYVKTELPINSLLLKKRKYKALPKKGESITTSYTPLDPQPLKTKSLNSSKTSAKKN